MSGIEESDRLGAAPHPREATGLSGHAAAEQELLDAYRAGRLHHAWLIGGAKGVGKATLAWRFARFLLAHPDPSAAAVREASSLAVAPDHPVAGRLRSGAVADLVVLRRQWNEKSKKHYGDIRVDDVRSALQMFQRGAGAGGFRLCILDSAEDLNRSSANALLKAIEEPPTRSVFLVVAHHPSQVMPTILSRCRKLFLGALSDGEVAHALDAMPGTAPADGEDRRKAIARSGGSVGRALMLLDEGRRAFDRDLVLALDALPRIDARALYRLADQLGVAEEADPIGALLETLLDWIDGRLHKGAQAGLGPHHLAPLAEVWDKLQASARDAAVLNLDKRPLVLSIFTDLAEAVRRAALP